MSMRFGEEFLTHKRRGTQGFGTNFVPPVVGSPVLYFSSSPDRSNPVPLSGATLPNTGPWYIFVLPESLAGPFDFDLDNGVFTHSEPSAPWDFVGTNEDLTAQPFTFATTGSHSINLNSGLVITDFSITVPVSGFNYFVSPSGNNAWNGLFPAFAGGINGPKQTFSGPTGALALLQPGQVLGARGGNYDEIVFNPTLASGLSTSQRTRIVNYNGEAVWIRPTTSYPTIDGLPPVVWRMDGYQNTTWAWLEIDGINLDGSAAGFNYSGCIALTARNNATSTGDVRNIRWQNSTWIGKDGAAHLGVLLAGPSGDTFVAQMPLVGLGNEFINIDASHGGMLNGPTLPEKGNAQHGLYIQGSNTLVQGCTVHDITGTGIYVFGNGYQPQTVRVIANTVHSSRPTGEPSPGHVGIGGNATGAHIYNNDIYNIAATGDGTSAIGISLDTNAQCYYNTIVSCDRFIEVKQTGAVARNNLGWQNATTQGFFGAQTPTQSNNVLGTTNPLFTDQSIGDFTLTSNTPSSIRTGGIVVNGPSPIPSILTDKDGVSRPNPPSVGAHQSLIPPGPFNYYVATAAQGGNDSNNGLAVTDLGGGLGPKRTIAAGLALLQPGQSLGIRGGTYDEYLRNPAIANGVSTTQRTRIANYNGETVWIKPTTAQPTVDGLSPVVFRMDGYQGRTWEFIEFEGINLDGSASGFNYSGCLQLVGRTQGDVRDIRWKNAEFIGKNGAAHLGIVFSGPASDVPDASQNTFGRRHEFINIIAHGGGMNNGPGPLEQGRFQHGFYAFGSELLIQGCTVYDITGAALHLFRSANSKATGIRVINTTLHSARPTGEPSPGHCGILDEQSGTLVYNVVIYNMSASGDGSNASAISTFNAVSGQYYFITAVNCDRIMDTFGGSGLTLRNILGWNNFTNQSPSGGGTITAQSNNSFGTVNPQFAGATDFHLTASTPTSIKTGGVAISGPSPIPTITTDKDGLGRSNPPSIGAYESLSGQQAYFDALVARPDVLASYSLRNEAQIDQYRGGNPPFEISYNPGADTYASKVMRRLVR